MYPTDRNGGRQRHRVCLTPSLPCTDGRLERRCSHFRPERPSAAFRVIGACAPAAADAGIFAVRHTFTFGFAFGTCCMAGLCRPCRRYCPAGISSAAGSAGVAAFMLCPLVQYRRAWACASETSKLVSTSSEARHKNKNVPTLRIGSFSFLTRIHLQWRPRFVAPPAPTGLKSAHAFHVRSSQPQSRRGAQRTRS